MLLRLVVGIVFFLALAPCQNRQGGEETEAGGEARRKAKEAMRGEKQDVEEENLTPEQRLARNITHGASAYCRFTTMLKPAKLMPGQSGTLKLVATMQGHAVLPSPSPLEMTPAPSQGPITVGSLTIKPADVGRLEPGYLGRPVYENYAELEVPVTMGTAAEVGKKYVVALDLKFDLYDGTSAQVIGRFLDRVATEIEVGSVPDPAVAIRPLNVKPAGDAAAVPTPPASDAQTPARGSKAPSAPLQGNAIIPASRPAETPVGDGGGAASIEPPSVDDGGGMLVPVVVGAGVLLLLLVLLLARKK